MNLPSEPFDEMEAIEYLNGIDGGYIGLDKPKLKKTVEFEDKPDQDNWAGDPEQAWA